MVRDGACPNLPFEAARVDLQPTIRTTFTGGHHHFTLGQTDDDPVLLERLIRSPCLPVSTMRLEGAPTDDTGIITCSVTAKRASIGLHLSARASARAGGEVFAGTSSIATDGADLDIRIPNLVELAAPLPGEHYELTGLTSAHLLNHFATPDTVSRLRAFVEEAFAVTDGFIPGFPGLVMRVNDMSLPAGGLFDVSPADFSYDPTTSAHKFHRNGVDVDFSRPLIPGFGTEIPLFLRDDLKATLETVAIRHGAFPANEDVIHYRFASAVPATLTP